MEAARNNGGSSLTLYFTKESHIHTLVNLVLLSGLPIANRRLPELDYCVSITGYLGEVSMLKLKGLLVTYNVGSSSGGPFIDSRFDLCIRKV